MKKREFQNRSAKSDLAVEANCGFDRKTEEKVPGVFQSKPFSQQRGGKVSDLERRKTGQRRSRGGDSIQNEHTRMT